MAVKGTVEAGGGGLAGDAAAKIAADELQALLDVMAQGRVIADRQWVSAWTQDGSNQIAVSTNNSPSFTDATNFIGMYANYESNKDKALLDSIEAGDVVMVTDRDTPDQWLVFRVAGTQYETGISSNFIGMWFRDADVLYKVGLDAYDDNWVAGEYAKIYIIKQMLDADGANHTDALKQAIREFLPTGVEVTEAQLTAATKMLLDDFDHTTLASLFDYHDQNHTGVHTITDYTFVTNSSTPNAGDVNIAVPINEGAGAYYIRPNDNNEKALLKNILRANKKVRFQVSETNYVEFQPGGTPAEFSGRLVGTYTAGTFSLVGSALANNQAISIVVESNIPARDELSLLAFGDIDDLPTLSTIANDDWVVVYDKSAGTFAKVAKSVLTA